MQRDDFLKRLGINVDGLELDLARAVAKESRYWLENDTKIKACQEGVPSYDQFRQRVAACHLRPLDRGERLDDQTKQYSGWTRPADNSSLPTSCIGEGGQWSTAKDEAVDTVKTFNRRWQQLTRNQPNNVKLDFLHRHLSPKLANELFASGNALLPQLIELLLEAEVEDKTAVDILTRCATPYFESAVDLLTSDERRKLELLLDLLTMEDDLTTTRSQLEKLRLRVNRR